LLARGSPLDGVTLFSYTAYGLNISSALALPELVPAEGPADLTVRFGKVELAHLDPVASGCIKATAREVHLYWEEAGTFLVRDGCEIVVDPAPGIDERIVRLVVLGPALGALLYQRGWLTLHASSLDVRGEAVALLGKKGEGKSTMAAALCARGHRLVADDVTAVQVTGIGDPSVYPGYPQLKLWPDAVASLGEDPDMIPQLVPIAQKRARRVTTGFAVKPLSLRRIYVLGGGDIPEITSLKPQEALVELIRHTYGRELLRAVETRSHFLRCTSVVNKVPINSLKRPYSLSRLSEVARRVEDDLAHGDERDVLDVC
jgi:hypothetical protein